jgi:hypothetical protein
MQAVGQDLVAHLRAIQVGRVGYKNSSELLQGCLFKKTQTHSISSTVQWTGDTVLAG